MFIPWWLIVIIGIVLSVAIGSAEEKHKATVSKLKKRLKDSKRDWQNSKKITITTHLWTISLPK